ncbi:MAG: hypothetical protein GY946_14480, partial [bacterium]|nr:hypothetical protein [bacterium]
MDIRNIDWKTYGETDINLLAVAITIAMSIVLFRCERKYAIIPILVVFHLIPHSVRLVIAGIDFSMMRLVIVVGLVRMLVWSDFKRIPKMNSLDKAFCIWILVGTVFHTLRDLSVGTLIYRIGFDLDALGIYFISRWAIRTQADIIRALQFALPMLGLIAIGMLIEWNTAYNVFEVIGADEQTWIKNGKVRPAGPMSNPIMAGSWGAGLVGLYLGMYMMGAGSRFGAIVGIVLGTAIMALSGSSGPAFAYMAVIGGGLLWPVRGRSNQIRWGVLGLMLFVHLVREKPVWHLIGRASELTGGTGYHRVRLIDGAVNQIGSWWLRGTKSTASWGFGLQDVTNHYLLEGVRGGIWTVIAFITVLVLSFKAIGIMLDSTHRSLPGRTPEAARRQEYFAWGLGVCLTSHCVAFISVSYFGQVQLLFFFLIACAGCLMDRGSQSGPNKPDSRKR